MATQIECRFHQVPRTIRPFISRLIFRHARVPRYWKESPAYWHHIATTWSSATAKWKIYLDGSLVSIMHDVAASSTIPAGGQLLLGTCFLSLAALYIGNCFH